MLNANVSYNRNRITALYGGVDEYELANSSLKYVVGHDAESSSSTVSPV